LNNNILKAIINLAQTPLFELKEYYSNHNRANSMGDALEEYIKDIFAGTYTITNEQERLEKISEVFSYLGNNSNPPDAMLKKGDAIEVKKIENNNASLALNSSYPKHKLFSDSPMISLHCRDAEEWNEKDIIYAVGVVDNNKLMNLSFVYGLDYCASEETYTKIKTKIKDGVEAIPGVEFAETRELGRVNKVDPLGITYLRVRGMWGIENPWTVFKYVYEKDLSKEFNFFAIINEEKYADFSKEDRKEFEDFVNKSDLNMTKVKIKNPDNPAILNIAYLITYSK
jgi:type-2 restriction enzyme ngoPII